MREEKTLDDDFELSLSFSLSLAFEARTFNHATLLVERILRSFFLVSQSTQQKGRLMTFACVRVFCSFFLKRLLFRVFYGKKFKNFQKPSRRLTSSSEEVFGRARIHHPHSKEDDFDQNDDDEFASFWKERCFFCSWSDESEELY